MGYLLAILASVFFGIIPSIQSTVLNGGVGPDALVVVNNGVAGLLGLAVGVAKKESFRLTKTELIHVALTGVIGLFITDYMLNVAYGLIPVGFTTMIHFLFPTIVVMGMIILFKERMTRGKLGAIVLSILGLALISGGDFKGSAAGILVALSTAFAYSFYMIENEKGPVRTIPQMPRLFYINLFVVTAALILIAARGGAVFPTGPMPIFKSVLCGVMLGLGLMMENKSIAMIGAGSVAFFNMVEPTTSFLVSLIVFRYHVPLISFVGCACILGSLTMTAMGDRKKVQNIETESKNSPAGSTDHK